MRLSEIDFRHPLSLTNTLQTGPFFETMMHEWGNLHSSRASKLYKNEIIIALLTKKSHPYLQRLKPDILYHSLVLSKEKSIRILLRMVRENKWEEILFVIFGLRTKGYNWPELDMIEKSAKKELGSFLYVHWPNLDRMRKKVIILKLFSYVKTGHWLLVKHLVTELKLKGYDWPELDVIEKSARKELN